MSISIGRHDTPSPTSDISYFITPIPSPSFSAGLQSPGFDASPPLSPVEFHGRHASPPFYCNVCRKHLARRNKARHMNMHGERRFSCAVCGDTFSRSDSRGRHMRKCSLSHKTVLTREDDNRSTKRQRVAEISAHSHATSAANNCFDRFRCDANCSAVCHSSYGNIRNAVVGVLHEEYSQPSGSTLPSFDNASGLIYSVQSTAYYIGAATGQVTIGQDAQDAQGQITIAPSQMGNSLSYVQSDAYPYNESVMIDYMRSCEGFRIELPHMGESLRQYQYQQRATHASSPHTPSSLHLDLDDPGSYDANNPSGYNEASQSSSISFQPEFYTVGQEAIAHYDGQPDEFPYVDYACQERSQ